MVTLLQTMPDIDVGAAADGQEAITLAEQHCPDVVLMDLRMPRVDGVEATRHIRADHPGVRVVLLTTYADDESITAALRAGAIGYLTKDVGRDHIRRALHAAEAGQAILDPTVQARLVDVAALPSQVQQHPARQLIEREAEILRLIAAGLSNTRSPHSSTSAKPPSRPTSTASSLRPEAATAPKPSPTHTAADPLGDNVAHYADPEYARVARSHASSLHHAGSD